MAIRDQATSVPEDFSNNQNAAKAIQIRLRREDEFWTWVGETCAAARTPGAGFLA
jgi:hypothetical protein